jgi:hypothetical protein
MPNLTTRTIYDPFSSSFRLLSYQLWIMQLRVVVDETLFWPTNGGTPSRPNLNSIHVVLCMSTPTGSWYFRKLPGLGVVAATKGYDVMVDSCPPLVDTDQDEEIRYKIAHTLIGRSTQLYISWRVQ